MGPPKLIDPPIAHHRRTSSLNDQSESALRPYANC